LIVSHSSQLLVSANRGVIGAVIGGAIGGAIGSVLLKQQFVSKHEIVGSKLLLAFRETNLIQCQLQLTQKHAFWFELFGGEPSRARVVWKN
jgi:hypothetical protein